MMHPVGDEGERGVVGPGPAVADFDALYQASYADMVRLAFFLIGSVGEAEQAVQNAFLQVYERWSSIDEPAAYLRTSVVNQARSWHRARFAAARRVARLARPERHLDHPDELVDALARLPRRRREVVVLRFYAGYSLAEIAALLGITEGTVKSTLHRGLNDLRKALT